MDNAYVHSVERGVESTVHAAIHDAPDNSYFIGPLTHAELQTVRRWVAPVDVYIPEDVDSYVQWADKEAGLYRKLGPPEGPVSSVTTETASGTRYEYDPASLTVTRHGEVIARGADVRELRSFLKGVCLFMGEDDA